MTQMLPVKGQVGTVETMCYISFLVPEGCREILTLIGWISQLDKNHFFHNRLSQGHILVLDRPEIDHGVALLSVRVVVFQWQLIIGLRLIDCVDLCSHGVS